MKSHIKLLSILASLSSVAPVVAFGHEEIGITPPSVNQNIIQEAFAAITGVWQHKIAPAAAKICPPCLANLPEKVSQKCQKLPDFTKTHCAASKQFVANHKQAVVASACVAAIFVGYAICKKCRKKS